MCSQPGDRGSIRFFLASAALDAYIPSQGQRTNEHQGDESLARRRYQKGT